MYVYVQCNVYRSFLQKAHKLHLQGLKSIKYYLFLISKSFYSLFRTQNFHMHSYPYLKDFYRGMFITFITITCLVLP